MSKLTTINIDEKLYRTLSIFCAPKSNRKKITIKDATELAIKQFLNRQEVNNQQNFKRRKTDQK